MNKKLLVVGILAVFILLAISMASAVNTTTPLKKNESPLFGIRTRQAIREKIGDVIENIKIKYIGERIFFLPITIKSIIEKSREGFVSDINTDCCTMYKCITYVPCENV